ncbi:MAG: FAD-binding oxidoreductase [Dehalococcoidia bacterium]|nr:FAD-binding oxidoreductase [Dehalococcoidia bacterium]
MAVTDLASLFAGLGELAAEPGLCVVDGVAPSAVVFPRDAARLAEVLRRAHAEGLAVSPRGGGTKVALGNPPRRLDLVVGTRELNGVVELQPANLTATFQAGVTLAQAQAALRLHGQFLPLESPFPERATLGGILATNVSGPRRLAWGTARDWLIGVRVVHAEGAATKAGGKVVKNVTGFDLNKLYVGSLGTLGVIVEAAFKVAPLPAVRRTLVMRFASVASAHEAALEAHRSGPGVLAASVLDAEAVRRIPGRLPLNGSSGACLLIEVGGRKAAVERRAAEVATLLGRAGSPAMELAAPDAEALWQSVVDLGWQPEDAPALVLRCGTEPAQAGALWATAQDELARAGLRVAVAAQPPVGVLCLLGWSQSGADAMPDVLSGVVASLRRAVAPLRGYVVVQRCAPGLKARLDVWGETGLSAALMRRVKERFDPAGVLNPGRFVGGI